MARLGAADLARDLGGGWTVGFALAHVAFWEARQEVAIRAWLDGAEFPDEDPTVNPSLEAMSAALNPGVVAASVEATCRRLDETVEGLTPQERQELADAGFGYAVAR